MSGDFSRHNPLTMWEQLRAIAPARADELADEYRGELEALLHDDDPRGRYPALIEAMHDEFYARGYSITSWTEAGRVTTYRQPTADDQRRADRYAATMARADAQWAHVVNAFKAAGFADTSVWQTGGMCLAVGVPLADGWYAMLTSAGGALDVDRRTEAGQPWIVGLYSPDDEHPSGNEGYVLDVHGSDAGDPARDEDLVAGLRPLLTRLAGR